MYKKILIILFFSIMLIACKSTDIKDKDTTINNSAEIKNPQNMERINVSGKIVKNKILEKNPMKYLNSLNDYYWLKDNELNNNKIILSLEEIENINKRLELLDNSIVDLDNFPVILSRQELKTMINKISKPFSVKRYDKYGKLLNKKDYNELEELLNLNNIKAQNKIKYGLTVNRGILKRYPSEKIATKRLGEVNFDKFTETAIYPGEQILVLHESKDKKWYFVQTYNYFAWLEKKYVAIGTRKEVLEYKKEKPFVVINSSKLNISYLKDDFVENINFELGTRIPMVKNTSSNSGVWIKIPSTNIFGNLEFENIFIKNEKDFSIGYLKYSSENVIKQLIKLNGELYGWGGLNLGRDCSSYVLDVYRSFGMKLPRNSSQQRDLEIYKTTIIPKEFNIYQRNEILDKINPGALLFMPGHVMVYLGKINKNHLVIHDFVGFYDNSNIFNYTMQVNITTLDLKSYTGEKYLQKINTIKELIKY